MYSGWLHVKAQPHFKIAHWQHFIQTSSIEIWFIYSVIRAVLAPDAKFRQKIPVLTCFIPVSFDFESLSPAWSMWQACDLQSLCKVCCSRICRVKSWYKAQNCLYPSITTFLEDDLGIPLPSMRLINCATIQVEKFSPSKIPQYAIILHRWEDDEIGFQEMENCTAATKLKKGSL